LIAAVQILQLVWLMVDQHKDSIRRAKERDGITAKGQVVTGDS
jgi:hypothetical protein